MPDLRATTKEVQHLVGTEPDGVWGPVTARAVLRRLTPSPPPEAPVPGDELDPRTLKWLNTLEPAAKKKFVPFIRRAKAIAATMGADYVAISGTRGEAEQNALYAKGRTAPGPRVTNAKYGFSNHNFGIALDFGAFSGRTYLDEHSPAKAAAIHKAVGAFAAQYGIDWGGNWKMFTDYPHFEVATGLSMAEKRRRLLNGTPILNA